MERHPISRDEEELEESMETSGVTGTTAPSADSGAPAIAEVMGSQIPGTLTPDEIEEENEERAP